jgi:hypothetical protein
MERGKMTVTRNFEWKKDLLGFWQLHMAIEARKPTERFNRISIFFNWRPASPCIGIHFSVSKTGFNADIGLWFNIGIYIAWFKSKEIK